MRGYNKMELSDGIFIVWTILMLLGVYMWHLGTLWPVWVVHIGDGVKRIQIYQKTLSSIVDIIWMSRVDLGLKLVFCVLESVCHAFYVVLDFCVSGLGLVLLFFCYYAMPVWHHINQSSHVTKWRTDGVFFSVVCGYVLWLVR